MSKVLIVDDDQDLCEMVQEWLVNENYKVEMVHSGADALSLFRCSGYDLIILDWELPDFSGIDICRRLRSTGDQVPIIFLTGRKHLPDKEVGFNAGGDDYLTKPFELKELSLRVKALLRRHKSITEDVLKARDLELDQKLRRVKRAGEEVKVAPKEFELLQFLMRHPNEIFKPGDLLRHVWSSDTEATDQTVRTCIKRLRESIDRDDVPSYVSNVHGHGYCLNLNENK
jgi:DNA-binding response OmpR family regulator